MDCNSCKKEIGCEKDCDKLTWRQFLSAFGLALTLVLVMAILANMRTVGAQETLAEVEVSPGLLPRTIFGMTWFRLSAYSSLIFFVLNFATCYAMPWAKIKEPWKGDRPGKDNKDLIGAFPLTHWHKIWAWFAVMTLSWHAFLGFSGVLFGKWL